jgi:hypothetical protein
MDSMKSGQGGDANVAMSTNPMVTMSAVKQRFVTLSARGTADEEAPNALWDALSDIERPDGGNGSCPGDFIVPETSVVVHMRPCFDPLTATGAVVVTASSSTALNGGSLSVSDAASLSTSVVKSGERFSRSVEHSATMPKVYPPQLHHVFRRFVSSLFLQRLDASTCKTCHRWANYGSGEKVDKKYVVR